MGCSDDLSCTTSSQNQAKDSSLLSIYPNPSIKDVTINIQNLRGKSFRLEIFNNTGNIIESDDINPINNIWSKELLLSKSGIYYFKVISDAGLTCKKVVVL